MSARWASGKRPRPGVWRWLLLLVLGPGLSACAHLQPPPPAEMAVEHRIRTEDGWELSLTRLRPAGEARGRPVLLVHGIAANARNLDFDDGHSLARWFARQGREAWTLSLRGTGTSDRPDPAAGRPAGHDFDTFWQQDLPAAIDAVRTLSGADRIDYVGHSMGGMLVYAYLGQGGDGLNRVITLGSPTRLDFGSTSFGLAMGLQPVVPATMQLPTRTLARMGAPLAGGESDPQTLLLINPENIPVERWRQFMVTGVDDVSGAVLLQLSQMVASGAFASADGTVDHRAGLSRIDTPVLVVAGKLDRFCPPMAAWDAYRNLGGEKAWLLMARTHGAQADYGHMDFVLGSRADVELWPQLLDFLDREGGEPGG